MPHVPNINTEPINPEGVGRDWTLLECSDRLLENRNTYGIHSGHFFQCAHQADMMVKSTYGQHQLKPGDLFYAPPGFQYSLHACEPGKTHYYTCRIRPRAFDLAQASDLEAWNLLEMLTRRIFAASPILVFEEGQRQRHLTWLSEMSQAWYRREYGDLLMIKSLVFALLGSIQKHIAMDQVNTQEIDAASQHRIQECLWFLQNRYTENIGIEDMAEWAGYSRSHFQALFRQYTGQTPIDYLTRLRMANASQLLLRSDLSVLQIAAECGYQSVSRFYEAFNKVMKNSPAAYRKTHGSRAED